MKDFTLKQYKLLLNALQHKGYSFQSFSQYIIEKKNSLPAAQSLSKGVTDHPLLILLRHDVEARYEQALQFAKIQNKLGIKGTYFFRLLPKSFKPKIVKHIADLGHEIGYHYDDLAVCKGDYKKAIERFQQNLETLRAIAPVQTICMDGSPLSKYDNKDLWNRGDTSASLSVKEVRRQRDKEIGRQGDFNTENTSPSPHVPTSLSPPKSFQDFGIIGEPYFDLDFNKTFYITDTGRRWDGHLFNVRDKATKENPVTNTDFLKLRFHTTNDMIQAIEQGKFPKQAMLNFHPQRWNDAFLPWIKELVWQNAKNQVKRFLVK